MSDITEDAILTAIDRTCPGTIAHAHAVAAWSAFYWARDFERAKIEFKKSQEAQNVSADRGSGG